jgi:hypothetical protein
MSRRRQSKDAALVEAIGGLVILFALGWAFSPEFRALIVLIICIAFACLAIWICYRLIKRKSQQPFEREIEWETSENLVSNSAEMTLSEQLRKIDWFQFEKLIELIYLHRGFSVKRLGGANPDGGVDLTVESPTEKFVVQCKHWRKWSVGVRQIREFLGTLTDTKIQNGIFITLTGYSGDAKQLADKHGIQILNETDVIKMLEESGLAYSKEISELFSDSRKFCPKCEREMVLRTARLTGNQFWGCSNYPRCKFILNLE